ncbi:hypothetical protein PI124_g11501 [Phytophthora idaei]|nr:hypothetical protein PI126_g10201 [Phytophthora idaei]KAG3243689.1 hypothetical protein PI124_g11501 [Phytophthora idaei]
MSHSEEQAYEYASDEQFDSEEQGSGADEEANEAAQHRRAEALRWGHLPEDAGLGRHRCRLANHGMRLLT